MNRPIWQYLCNKKSSVCAWIIHSRWVKDDWLWWHLFSGKIMQMPVCTWTLFLKIGATNHPGKAMPKWTEIFLCWGFPKTTFTFHVSILKMLSYICSQFYFQFLKEEERAFRWTKMAGCYRFFILLLIQYFSFISIVFLLYVFYICIVFALRGGECF